MAKKISVTVWCLLPVSLIIISVVLLPVIFALFVSFHQWDLSVGGQLKYTGLDNYLETLQDKYFWQAIFRSLLFILVTVPVEVLAGLMIALLLNRDIIGGRLWRVLVTIPMMITPVVVATLWKIIYNSELGILNWLLGSMGIIPKIWLGDQTLAFFSLAFVEVWQYTPFLILFFLAGLQSIPRELYEAAQVDGASGGQMLRYIILPYLKNVIVLGVIFRVVDVFRVFDIVISLTNGGPGRSTEFVSFYTYSTSFRVFKLGMASAQSFILMFVTLMIALPLIYHLTRGVRARQEA